MQKPRLAHLAEFLEKSETTPETTKEYRPFDSIDKTTVTEIRTKAREYYRSVGEIEDVTQATDLQASCVAFSTYKEERRGINWLLCDFEIPQTEETVREICESLTARRKLAFWGYVNFDNPTNLSQMAYYGHSSSLIADFFTKLFRSLSTHPSKPTSMSKISAKRHSHSWKTTYNTETLTCLNLRHPSSYSPQAMLR